MYNFSVLPSPRSVGARFKECNNNGSNKDSEHLQNSELEREGEGSSSFSWQSGLTKLSLSLCCDCCFEEASDNQANEAVTIQTVLTTSDINCGRLGRGSHIFIVNSEFGLSKLIMYFIFYTISDDNCCISTFYRLFYLYYYS